MNSRVTVLTLEPLLQLDFESIHPQASLGSFSIPQPPMQLLSFAIPIAV